MTEARWIVRLVAWGVFALLAAGLAADLLLILAGQGSVTAYLRAEPWQFWRPFLALQGLLLVLILHLFVFTKWP